MSAGKSEGVVFVSNSADSRASLSRIFKESPWKLHVVATAGEGLSLLRRRHYDIPVMMCEQTSPNGDWRRLLWELGKLPVAPSVIVVSRLAEERLWAEVLNLGAYDLLLGDPFEPAEVLRVTENAWHAFRQVFPACKTPAISRDLREAGKYQAVC
jgi:DNA-binding response OmpR family regulator